MIPFVIDGQSVEGKEDGNVLEVALDAGIEIPHLCYHESVKPYGACRLCLVEVVRNGRSRMTTSCTYPVQKGIEVLTRTDKVLRARRMMIELILAMCPGDKRIQEMAQEMGVEEVGELVINGPQVMQGYWNMPAETANVLRALPDGKTWLFTGDIAKMDKDGYFYIVDRKKDMVIAGGYNVYPREVEEVVKEHPKVLDVAAAGIPDPHRGETIKVWIVPKPGETLTEEDVKTFCRDRLAKYKIPTQVEFRTELPKTMVGKILRRALVEEETKRQAGK